MDMLEVGVDPHPADRIEPVDAEELIRPADPVAGDCPFPAADVGQLLRFLEVRALAIEAFERSLPLRERGAENEQAEHHRCEQAFRNLNDLGGGVTPSGVVPSIAPL